MENNKYAIFTWLVSQQNSPQLDIRELSEQLRSLENTFLPPDQGGELLDMLFARFATELEGRISPLVGARIPLLGKIRQEVNILQDLLDRFAHGYEKSLQDRIGLLQTEDMAVILEKVGFCLRNHLYISHLTSGLPGLNIWRRLHNMFLLGSRKPALAAESNHYFQHYTKALLLACASPSSFCSRELAFVEQYIDAWGFSRVTIQEYLPLDSNGVFWIDTNRDLPAFALIRRTPPPDTPVFYFSCNTMAHQTNIHLDELNQQTPPFLLKLPQFAATPTGKGSLRRLAKSWGTTQKRQFPRRRQSCRATLCPGLNRIWRLLENQDQVTERELSQWMIVNESPGGYVLMHLNGKLRHIQAGDITALKLEEGPDSQGKWFICLVRWVISQNPEHMEIGLQILSSNATPALLKHPDNQKEEAPVLLLPKYPPLQNANILIAATGTINQNGEEQVLATTTGNQLLSIQTLTVWEETSRIEMLRFETTDL